MTTNKEFLYSLDPHALTEWFESEHDFNDTLAAKKVVSVHTGTANDANVSTRVETANGTLDGARAALDAKFAELTAKCYELQAKVDVLTYERDYYIGLCHRAVEAGEKFATLVDMNGEVLS